MLAGCLAAGAWTGLLVTASPAWAAPTGPTQATAQAAPVALTAPATPTAPAPPAPVWPTPVPSAPIPAGTDDPSPAAPGPAGDPLDPGGRDGDPGMFDIGGKIRKAINDWFRNLVTSASSSLLDALGRTVLTTPDPSTNPRIRDLWSTAVIIANTCFGLFVVVGGLIGMSYETLQTRTAVKDILPRLVVGFVAANASLGLVGQAVRFTNALAHAFTGQGAAPGDGVTFSKLVIVPVAGDGIFLILLCLVIVVLAAVLLVTCIMRAAVIVLLAVSGPLALCCHALPQTEGVANLWWRALTATLGVQIAQAFTLVTAVRVFLVSDGTAAAGLTVGGRLINILLAICLLWVCIRIPSWARHMIFNGGGRRSLVGTVVRTLIVAKTLGLARTGLSRLGPGRPPGPGRRGPGGSGPGAGGRPTGPAGPRPRPGGGPNRGPRGGPRGGPGGGSGGPGGGRGPGPAGVREPRRPRPTTPAGSGTASPGREPALARTRPTAQPGHPTGPTRPAGPGRRTGDAGWAEVTPTRLGTPDPSRVRTPSSRPRAGGPPRPTTRISDRPGASTATAARPAAGPREGGPRSGAARPGAPRPTRLPSPSSTSSAPSGPPASRPPAPPRTLAHTPAPAPTRPPTPRPLTVPNQRSSAGTTPPTPRSPLASGRPRVTPATAGSTAPAPSRRPGAAPSAVTPPARRTTQPIRGPQRTLPARSRSQPRTGDRGCSCAGPTCSSCQHPTRPGHRLPSFHRAGTAAQRRAPTPAHLSRCRAPAGTTHAASTTRTATRTRTARIASTASTADFSS